MQEQESEFTNELGVPDTRVTTPRTDQFAFSVSFSVQRSETCEEFTYTFNAKVWQSSRVYLTRDGLKGTLQYGWYDIQTNQFYATDKRNLLPEWAAMVQAFRAKSGY